MVDGSEQRNDQHIIILLARRELMIAKEFSGMKAGTSKAAINI
jgi:hypothetical protein